MVILRDVLVTTEVKIEWIRMKTGKTRKYGLILLLSFILIATATISVGSSGFESKGESKNLTLTQTYIDHGAVQIDGDAEFLTTAADEGWSGTGTVEDPIIIEGYKFYATLVQPVRIWRTDLHWVFRNNIVTTDGIICGLWTDTTTGGLIFNNTFDRCHSGVVIQDDENLIVEDNVFVGNTGNGVDIVNTFTNGIIRNNEFYDLGGDGITSDESIGVEIYGNFIHDITYDGIDVADGQNNVIRDNVILDIRTGIRLGRSASDNEISNNTIQRVINNGINCLADSNTIEHNTIRDVGINGIIFSESMGAFADNNIVSDNIFINCTDYTIEISEGCTSNEITDNDFFETSADCHICDDGEATTINGNFFDIWAAPDANEDDIVDTPYSLDGSAGNADAAPVAAPINELPSDYEYVPMTETSTDIGNLPLMEIAIVGGASLVICFVIIIFIRKR